MEKDLVPPNELLEKLNSLPLKPGVYLFRDSNREILYIGKARVLWNRVHSYFQNEPYFERQNPRLRLLISKIKDLEYILCDSEMEALLLEYNLIKEHHPPFNVRFRDDKRFPYIKLITTDPFPYLTIVRKKQEDGNRYFGPYVSSSAMRQTLKAIRKIFQIRSCSMKITGHERVCLYYHLKECSAPCTAAISQSEYQEKVKNVTQFLEGKKEPLIRELTSVMEKASQNLEFEKAAYIRDQIEGIKTALFKQKVAGISESDEDYVGIMVENGTGSAEIFHVRSGNLIKKEQFIFESAEALPEESLSAFIRQHYQETEEIPPLMFLSHELEDQKLLKDLLSQKSKHPVHLEVPKKGGKRKLLDLLLKNASHDLTTFLLKETRLKGKLKVLESLQKLLRLPRPPFRIEGYDISTLFGKESVGSMVVFIGGTPEKKLYRKFAIQCKSTPDDFAMMKEMLFRRVQRLKDPGEDESFSQKPDLILLDGGKGQLSVGIKALKQFFQEDIPIISLAKEEEEIYLPAASEPIKLLRTDSVLKLLQHVRDEAHRFAVTFHKTKRDKKMTESSFEAISGIGKKRIKKLLETYGSLAQIKAANIEEIAGILKCSKTLAEKIIAESLKR